MTIYLPGSVRQICCDRMFTTMDVCFHVATLYALSNVLVAPTGACSGLHLSGEPDPVAEGDTLVLSCMSTSDDVPPLLAVIWSRNTEAIFQTVQAGGLECISNTTGYYEVFGRINLTTDRRNHNVMLQINSSVDDGSVWRCNVDDYSSNNLTVNVLIKTTVPTSVEGHLPTTDTDYGLSSTEESPSRCPRVYLIAGSSVGLVIVTVFVIALCMKHIAVGRVKDTERVKGVHETEEPENVMVDNVCYVGLDDDEAEATTGGAPLQRNVPGTELPNMNALDPDPGSSVLILENPRSDMNDGYASIDIVIETTGPSVDKKYVNAEAITDTTGSQLNDS